MKQISASEIRTRPTVSNTPPVGSGDSFTPNRITKKQTTMSTAGTSSTTVSGRESISAPPTSAPTIAPQLERRDQEARGPRGDDRAALHATRPRPDQRDLERQPHDVEAHERPRGEEHRERVGERQHERGRGGEGGRDQQHPLVADHVAELRERRHDERRQHELRALEPVDVGVVDAEMPRDVGEHGRVVALQHAARELDEREEADDGREGAKWTARFIAAPSSVRSRACAGAITVAAASSARWNSSPRSSDAISTRSSTPWIDARCAFDISSGANR